MRIVFVVPILAPYAIPRFQELAKFDDVDVHVVVEKATSSDRIGWKYEEIDGVTTHLVKKSYSHNFIKNNKKGNYTQNDAHIFSLDLNNIINNINPDVVLVCNSSQLLMLSLGKREYKLGVIVEDTLRADENRNIINRFVKKKLLKIADFYCTFSDDSVAFLNEYGVKGPIIKTSWSINNIEFTNLTNDEIVRFKKNNEIDSCKTNFLIVANLIKRKGIIEFIHSWEHLPKNVNDNVSLLIAGEGPERKNIEDTIKRYNIDNITLLGHVKYNDIKKYLQVVDVFVLPTLEDLNSLSVYEALAASKPLLISKYNGSRFLVLENKNGFIFDPYSINDTVDKINSISNADLIEMSRISCELSKQYTNIVVMNKFYYELLNII
ncbi:MAG: glycosyltransferase family 4 protein [Lachnospiraceae bacterium]|nr:glycosyltransferase family 4 protein [Lachnospiraceae bacterium]